MGPILAPNRRKWLRIGFVLASFRRMFCHFLAISREKLASFRHFYFFPMAISRVRDLAQNIRSLRMNFKAAACQKRTDEPPRRQESLHGNDTTTRWNTIFFKAPQNAPYRRTPVSIAPLHHGPRLSSGWNKFAIPANAGIHRAAAQWTPTFVGVAPFIPSLRGHPL